MMSRASSVRALLVITVGIISTHHYCAQAWGVLLESPTLIPSLLHEFLTPPTLLRVVSIFKGSNLVSWGLSMNPQVPHLLGTLWIDMMETNLSNTKTYGTLSGGVFIF